MATLVTGGTGFLGRHLVRHLVENGEKDVVVMDVVPNRNAIADVADQVRLVPGDVRETTALLDTIQKYGVEGIIHLAYFLGTGGTRNPLPSINVNCIGTTNVFEAARLSGVKRVVYMSSVAVFPTRHTLDGPELTEDDPPHPIQCTARASSSMSISRSTIIKRTSSTRSVFARLRSSAKVGVSAVGLKVITSWWPPSSRRSESRCYYLRPRRFPIGCMCVMPRRFLCARTGLSRLPIEYSTWRERPGAAARSMVI